MLSFQVLKISASAIFKIKASIILSQRLVSQSSLYSQTMKVVVLSQQPMTLYWFRLVTTLLSQQECNQTQKRSKKHLILIPLFLCQNQTRPSSRWKFGALTKHRLRLNNFKLRNRDLQASPRILKGLALVVLAINTSISSNLKNLSILG